jgi:hypothetical protein
MIAFVSPRRNVGTRDAGFGTRDAGFGVRDSGVRDSAVLHPQRIAFQIPDPNSESRIPDP